MKMKILLAGLLAILSLNIVGQDRCDQDQLKINLKQYQNSEMTISSLSYSGDFKEETLISRIILPKIEITENRRFNPKKGKTRVTHQLVYNSISAEDALESFVSDLKESGSNAFYNLKISPESQQIKTGNKSETVPGYRIEGVAIVI
jgi:hypothetical protein